MNFPININNVLLLAPMAGYTDSPFRRIALKHGAGLVFTELLSAEGIIRNNQKTLDMLSFYPDEKPLGIQIFGNDPDTMAEAAYRVLSYNPDCIDINCGCCAPKVFNNGKGAALLSNIVLLQTIVSRIVEKVPIPVSAKIRLGITQSTKNYCEVVKSLEDAGISFITMHGRTRDQYYGGKADWDAIGEIASTSQVPIVGNGDISSYNDAIEKLQMYGCSAVMIGRRALGNPWIFNGKIPTIDTRISTIITHYQYMTEYYGDYGIILMRKHIAHYLKGFPYASKLRQKLLTIDTLTDIFEILTQPEDIQ